MTAVDSGSRAPRQVQACVHAHVPLDTEPHSVFVCAPNRFDLILVAGWAIVLILFKVNELCRDGLLEHAAVVFINRVCRMMQHGQVQAVVKHVYQYVNGYTTSGAL